MKRRRNYSALFSIFVLDNMGDMGTMLFDQVIFGPVRSRRLGLSLGVNLLPTSSKLCNFECIYCECGWSGGEREKRFNSKEDVLRLLEAKLVEMKQEGELPDTITFAGNGEPTMHPDFEQIIERTIELRNRLAPKSKVSVLSNATMIGKKGVRRALRLLDNPILKLDSALDETVRLLNNPKGEYSVEQVVGWMKAFDGDMIIQTMFLRGEYDGQTIDNTTEKELKAWLEVVQDVAPKGVMIYTIDRQTPAKGLEKVSVEELRQIATRVEAIGIECSVSG